MFFHFRKADIPINKGKYSNPKKAVLIPIDQNTPSIFSINSPLVEK
jgi:hypothetical protein